MEKIKTSIYSKFILFFIQIEIKESKINNNIKCKHDKIHVNIFIRTKINYN